MVMTKFLPGWVILAGGTALATAAFFASTGVTHWVMGLHQTDVVVRPGPTVYVTVPAAHGHAHKRAQPTPAPVGVVYGGVPSPTRAPFDGAASRQPPHARPGHTDGRRQGHGQEQGQEQGQQQGQGWGQGPGPGPG